MKRFLILAALFATILPANAIIWQYGDFNSTKKECAITGWSGTQPTSGKLTLPESYKHSDGITYTVTTVGPHALDNLTTVSEITIPASITQIGDAGAGSSPCDTRNFSNCPVLDLFIVKSGSKSFKSRDGLLYTKCTTAGDFNHLLAVPQAIDAPDGTFSVPSPTTEIAANAFAGNTTITTLSLPANCAIEKNGGLNFAKKIKSYKIYNPSSGTLQVISGMLYNGAKTLVSCPPAITTASITVPKSTTKIGQYAFANTRKVTDVNLSSVKTISYGAFLGSGLTSVKIPASVTSIGEYTFDSSSSLASIQLTGTNLTIPGYFAQNCSALKKVTSSNAIKEIERSAFKNCKALTSFPFSGATNLYGDSIFFGCGFTKVKFSSEPSTSEASFGYCLFSSCASLQTIDASAITATKDNPYTLLPNYASNCLKLTTLKLPAFTSPRVDYFVSNPLFGYTCALTRIEMGTFWYDGSYPLFCYSSMNGATKFYPEVYISVTANSDLSEYYNEWCTELLFGGSNGATVYPQIYCDAFTPSESYVYQTATYNIPGGTSSNYGNAIEAGCTVRETYGIKFEKEDGKMRVTITPAVNSSATVENFTVKVNNGSEKELDANGSIITGVYYNNIQKIRVSYTLNGVAMSTDYPAKYWAAVEGIEIDEDTSEPIYYNLQGIRIDNPGNGLYIRRTAKGSEVVRL